jgi:hypothetical protein
MLVGAFAGPARADVMYGVGFMTIDFPDTAGTPNTYELVR